MSVLSELRAVTRADKGAKRTKERHRDNRAAYLFMLPWLIGLAVITIGPMLASLYLAFTNYNLLQPPDFTGLANIQRMIGDDSLHHSLGVTLLYVCVSVPLQLAVALLLALMLDKGLRGLALYRSIFYLPSLLGSSVAVAILWKQVFGAKGIVNGALALVGIHADSWIANPSTALWTLIALNVWAFGSPMVIFLAGLRQIPTNYYEAARIDGASRLQLLRNITLPLLTPIIFFNLVLQVINAFQSFTQAYVISSGTGGPVDSTLFYTLYLYTQGFVNFNMGYASSMAWLLLLIIGAFTALNFWASRFWVVYDD